MGETGGFRLWAALARPFKENDLASRGTEGRIQSFLGGQGNPKFRCLPSQIMKKASQRKEKDRGSGFLPARRARVTFWPAKVTRIKTIENWIESGSER